MSSNKQAIQTALHQFSQSNLFEAGINLFSTLGYKTSRQNRLDDSSKDGFKSSFVAPGDTFDESKALLNDWRQVELLFQLTQAEVTNETSLFDTSVVDRTRIETYLFWAIDLLPRINNDKTPKPYSRTDFAQATRELNRLFPMPCLVLFRHDGYLTLAVIDRRLHKRDATRDVLEKVTLIKDIALDNTHPGHLNILNDLSFDELYRQHRFDSFVALHRAWQKTLDTSLLNKKFYEELFTWYLWAKSHPQLWFPKPDEEKLDNEAYYSVSVIRLLTRLIFVWFIKEKGLVPDQLFNQNALKELLKDFNANSAQAADFYRAILQNLFFATLNTPMAKDTDRAEEKRQFVDFTKKGQRGYSEAYGDQTKYRYVDCFRDPQEALQVFESVPFLNGGLFECLDYPENKETGTKERRYDGFSMTEKKQARVPNQLFFGEYELTDQVIAEMGGKVRKGLKLKGLVDILNGYKFTITENTPLEEEVALDPELLGKVFENLLASYNPETKVTARKQTGSFYTPREIVNYMVDESLKAYLLHKLTIPVAVVQTEFGRKQTQLFGNEVKRGQLGMLETVMAEPVMSKAEARQKLDVLFDDRQQINPFGNDPALCEKLIDAFSEAKILDPACGSGAYPMGVLHRMVNLLSKLDPNNRVWKEAQLRKAERDRLTALRFEDPDIREKAVDSADRRIAYIRESFANSRHELDYTRKLFLIENCIYGVDIQQVAVQIAKLRFFISLIVDQGVDDTKPNRNVLSMPNLETKFVAANTLVSLEKPKQLNVFGDSAEVKKVESELHELRQQIFFVRRYRDKKKLQIAEAEKREELQRVLERFNYPKGTANQIAGWNPFDVMHSAGFLDTITMFNFGPNDGFDIVIGNPPYVQLQKLDEETKAILQKQQYETYAPTGDLYQLFYEAGLKALVPGGLLCYITSNKWMRTDYGRITRNYFATRYNTKKVVDFGMALVFESATTLTNIILIAKEKPDPQLAICRVGSNYTTQTLLSEYVTANQIEIANPGDGSWIAYSKREYDLIKRIEAQGVPLKEWDIKINYGIKTGFNSAFIIDTAQRDRLVAEDPRSADIIKPVLRGEDIKAYVPQWAGKWLIYIPWHFPLHEDPTITGSSKKAEEAFKKQYPAVFAHLETYNKQLSARNKAETGIRYEWYCLQRWGANYYREFDKPKIIYPNMTKFLPFVLDKDQFFTNQKCFIITGNDLGYLTAFFNSRLFRFTFKEYFPELLGDTRELSKVFFENVTVKPVNRNVSDTFMDLIVRVQELKKQQQSTIKLEAEIESKLSTLYGLSDADRGIIEADGLD